MPRRSSKRLNGEKPDYVEIDDDDRPKYSDVEELVDLMGELMPAPLCHCAPHFWRHVRHLHPCSWPMFSPLWRQPTHPCTHAPCMQTARATARPLPR